MFDEMWKGLVAFFLVCLVLSFIIGAGLAILLPEIWEWLKPLIHAVTA